MAALVHDSQFMTRRGAVLVAIVALHVFIGWALATGLARRAIEVLAPPIQTTIVEETKKEEAPPPPPPPQFERPPVELPPPDVTINMPVESDTTAIRVVNTPVVKAPVVAAPTRRTALVTGKGFPNSEDFYPEASKRLDEQGALSVHVCVGPDGKLTEEPTIAKSSGSARLDAAGIKLAKAGSGKFVAATEDGKGVVACANLPIKFQLR
jgi:protein TonB